MRKGQLISTDMLVAFVIFILIADASIIMWQSELSRAGDIESRNFADEAARSASNQLLTSGDPSNWNLIELNESSFHSFGLTSSSNVVEWDKIEGLRQLKGDPAKYGMVKRALGLEFCEVWLAVLYSNGTVIESFGEVAPQGTPSVSIDRKAMLNSSPVTVRLEVWR
ncbi:MAG: hypothetical protein Sv326_0583 [Candidatus Fermentimicrarchaeum limneticum]|uniref:Uncharacterized protein n=1 Tax=Fermentimicrarchaeum limneticum TaxID=2795018 RepID=A0A7D6BLW1_FERL1|nr:MAG: hypothetical protein Sv326_0583 [Candidatus Fermentimicrarchaeum limneticum]